MKLRKAIEYGYINGIRNLREAVFYTEKNIGFLYGPEDIEKEAKELYNQYILYLSGELQLDFDRIKRECTKTIEDF